MATSDQKRRAKLAKKQAKDRRRHKSLAVRQQMLASAAGKMQSAAGGPIVKCLVGDSLQGGMGTLIFARRAEKGQVAWMIVLLDTYLLGVKDAFAQVDTLDQLEQIVERIGENEGTRELTPGQARGLAEAAIAYARKFGFEPHVDYRKCEPLWGDVVAEPVDDLVTFGQDGKPCYISGMESPEMSVAIINRLQEVCGAGNFHYVMRPRPDVIRRIDETDYEDDESDD